MKYLIIVILLCFLRTGEGRTFFAVSKPQKTAYYQCFKQSGFDKIGIVLNYDQDQVDSTDYQNLLNAQTAGLAIELLIPPNRCMAVQKQIQLLKSNINMGLIDRFWIVPGGGPCDWVNYSAQSNCEHLLEFVSGMKKQNYHVGIVAQTPIWRQIFRNQTGCQQVSQQLCWWFPQGPQFDGQANFDSYHQVGGWKTPYMKLYQLPTICGQQILANYYI